VGVNGYSYSSPPAWNLHFDAERRMFNFTVGEPYLPGGEVSEFVVIIPKGLLDGSPIVFMDNVMVRSALGQNATHYYIRFSYLMSHNDTVTHNVMVGGSNTVPENANLLASMATTVGFLYLFSRRKPEKKIRTRASSGCEFDRTSCLDPQIWRSMVRCAQLDWASPRPAYFVYHRLGIQGKGSVCRR
jgi:hypothetical protein